MVAIQTVFVKVLGVTPNEQENTEVSKKCIRLQEMSIHTHFGQTQPNITYILVCLFL